MGSKSKPSSAQGSQPSAAQILQPKPVTISAIEGVTLPVIGKTPVKAITETAQYTGTVTWSPAVTGTFQINTQYTATVTLTAKPGYTLQGVAANFFTVAKAESASNDENSGVVTAAFPSLKAVINIASIAGVKAPAAGETPVTKITEAEQYSGTITWSPEVSGTFKSETQYTATITLAAKDGYVLEGVKENFFKVAGAKTANGENSGVVTAAFPPTINAEDAKLKMIGFSLGTSFAEPLVIGTIRGTFAPFNYSFIELGADAGWGINLDYVEYYSAYPYANFTLFAPFARTADGKRGGFYAGAGVGAMFEYYIFNDAGPIWDTTVAANIVIGFNLFDMFDVSYTIRTNFETANNKLSVGYVYRFK
ncbi:hypothetical protein [Treponema sp. R80B11-R83G3]